MSGKFEIHTGDITTYATDAIVNAAKESLLGGGGVDGAIHAAAGPDLYKECCTLGGCETGQAKITKGYRLPCQYVIHAVGPRVMGYEPTEQDKALLQSAYHSSLVLANEHGLSTIAFSSISTGHYSFDPNLAAPIAIKEILTFLSSHENTSIEKVIMVCYTDYVKEAFVKALQDITNPNKSNESLKKTDKLVAFYLNTAPDHKGRYLHQILSFNALRLEFIHDYIQWIFPTDEPSKHNPYAPILAPSAKAAFQENDDLQANMLRSLRLMLNYYGFTIEDTHGVIKIVKAKNFRKCSKRWLRKKDHNHLRITRILKSLRLCGLPLYADAFQQALLDVCDETNIISPQTISYWLSS